MDLGATVAPPAAGVRPVPGAVSALLTLLAILAVGP